MNECRPQAFAPESASAVKGTIDLDVTRNLVRVELPETDAREIDMLEHGPQPMAEQDHGRMKFNGLAAARGELLAAASGIAWLVVDLAAADCDLVGTEDPGLGCSRSDGSGFRMRQTECACARQLAGDGCLVDAGQIRSKRQGRAGRGGMPGKESQTPG